MCVRVREERREDDAELLELGMTAINVLDGRTSRNDGLEINTIFNLPPPFSLYIYPPRVLALIDHPVFTSVFFREKAAPLC